MRKVTKNLALALLVLILICCIASGVGGTYVCTKSSEKLLGFHEGDILEFKQNGEVYIKSSSGQGVVGNYEVNGNRVTITVSILGTKYLFEGLIEGSKITFKDGSIFEKK
ncbi:MAG: hypothetical protein QFX40_02260 [Archaeoglobales archaeon]|nr:hypothetical protein [Archaeoglobales archaeon]